MRVARQYTSSTSNVDVEAVIPACTQVLDIELSKPVPGLQPAIVEGQYCRRAWVLVRLYGEPLGAQTLDIPPEGLSSETVVERLLASRLPSLYRMLEIDDSVVARGQVLEVIHKIGSSAFSRSHHTFLSRAQRCSVVVCTRDRPDELRRCLNSLVQQDHPDFAVWVVDNTAGNNLTREVAESYGDDIEVHYVVEPRSGLSRARNRALEQDLGDIVAWLDDDEVADSMWLSELVRAFEQHPEVVGASGLVVPAELLTKAQVWFEQFGGHSKGRGFIPDKFSQATRSRQHPLYPLPPFGVGANMAFRTKALRQLGGFDEALGAGTPAQGAEDTKVFTDFLLAGESTLYWPSAITRHFHRRDLNGLRRQMRGYGAGLAAFYTAEVFSRPSTVLDLLRLAPRALRDVYSRDSPRVATVEEDFPRILLAQNRREMVVGPWLYLRGRIQNWRAARS